MGVLAGLTEFAVTSLESIANLDGGSGGGNSRSVSADLVGELAVTSTGALVALEGEADASGSSSSTAEAGGTDGGTAGTSIIVRELARSAILALVLLESVARTGAGHSGGSGGGNTGDVLELASAAAVAFVALEGVTSSGHFVGKEGVGCKLKYLIYA